MIIQARTVVTMDGPPLENGAVSVRGNQIQAVGHASLFEDDGEQRFDLGDAILLPGLINGHCHLDYTMMRHAIVPPTSFTAWVRRINALKRSLDTEDYLASIATGFCELKRWGTTSVCNIESFPELMPKLPPSPIRTWWIYEMIDIRHRITTEEVVAGALVFFQHRGHALDHFGLSPHAPFTSSKDLYHLANECAKRFEMILTTHIAESREELQMFQRAKGPLYDFMKSLGRPMNDCGKGTPFQQLWRSGAINERWLLAHMNELTDEDFDLIRSLGENEKPQVVHCPGSHHYFRHSPFPFQRLKDLGVNISVATDSLASADSLSLLGELRLLRVNEPWLSGEDLLRTITTNPARALQQTGRLGAIQPGALADLIAIPHSGNSTSVYDEIIAFERPIPWMMIDGQIAH